MVDRLVDGQAQQYGDAQARFQDEAGPSTSQFHTTTQSQGAPPPIFDSLFHTPPDRPFFQSFDHGGSTSFGGSFTQLLRSEYRGLMEPMRPSFNTSAIPYTEYSQSPVHGMDTFDTEPVTHVAENPPQGDEEQGRRRSRRTVRHPRCGTGGSRHHH
ncbi:hypothetical protein F511_28918 [Dorcoceras hygrometricum]|uniref:Uncharacterized protein n=1 Tax=Dorcoceras hygrometricum TaxID=472368 RepID=A0A2Z7AEI5_9LAMI|nr:hypothetical protein F511_28918 [Dorcoceras hygrometricum]